MVISYHPTKDLHKSAELTYRNMCKYYEHFAVDWSKSTILEQISGLDNWDILRNKSTVIGALRLSVVGRECWLRDLQVDEEYQNKGVGSHALYEAKAKAVDADIETIKLRVFKISPAYKLYKRHGFRVGHEDDKFYYMDKDLI